MLIHALTGGLIANVTFTLLKRSAELGNVASLMSMVCQQRTMACQQCHTSLLARLLKPEAKDAYLSMGQAGCMQPKPAC